MALRYFVEEVPVRGECSLSKDIARHLATVLRARVGDMFCLFDGRGVEAEVRVIAMAKRELRIEVIELRRHERPASATITVAFSPPPEARLAQILEHGTELGVACFQPTRFERSKPSAGAASDRRRRIVQAAAGQCGALFVPSIHEDITLKDLVANFTERPDRTCHPVFVAERPSAWRGASIACHELAGALQHADDVFVVVGPEGGFTELEVEALRSIGARALSVGDLVLRVETAVLAATAIVRSSLP